MKKEYTFQELIDIMANLRSENGCPWDREQTYDTLKKYLLEEAYEVVDTIEEGNREKHCEELGDVLLQVVFQSQVAAEEGAFDINDVISTLCSKLISRHPHVFGNEIILEAEGVEKRWDEIKYKVKRLDTQTKIMEDIPKSFPSLIRSYKVQKKAAEVGFDWNDVEDSFKKVYEKIDEVKEARELKDKDKIYEEMGDLLFAVVNVSRFLKVEPETALSSTINKFIKRFSYIEEKASLQGRDLKSMTLEEMDELWDEAKKLKNISNKKDLTKF